MKSLFGVVMMMGMVMMLSSTFLSIVYFIWEVARSDAGFWSIVGATIWNWCKFFFGGLILAVVGNIGGNS